MLSWAWRSPSWSRVLSKSLRTAEEFFSRSLGEERPNNQLTSNFIPKTWKSATNKWWKWAFKKTNLHPGFIGNFVIFSPFILTLDIFILCLQLKEEAESKGKECLSIFHVSYPVYDHQFFDDKITNDELEFGGKNLWLQLCNLSQWDEDCLKVLAVIIQVTDKWLNWRSNTLHE